MHTSDYIITNSFSSHLNIATDNNASYLSITGVYEEINHLSLSSVILGSKKILYIRFLLFMKYTLNFKGMSLISFCFLNIDPLCYTDFPMKIIYRRLRMYTSRILKFCKTKKLHKMVILCPGLKYNFLFFLFLSFYVSNLRIYFYNYNNFLCRGKIFRRLLNTSNNY